MENRADILLRTLKENEAAYITSYPNIFYYSGFTSSDASLIISHDRRILITDSRYILQAKKQAAGFEIMDIKKGLENIFALIKEDTVGYEEKNVTVKRYRELRIKLGSNKEPAEMQKRISAPRRIKSTYETEKIAAAERIGDEAFSYILGRIKAGRTEREIALELEFFMKKQGASALSFETIAASGVRSAMPHGAASEKAIEKGELLTLDFGCVFEGYCSDMTRTVVVGRADEGQREIYELVLRAQKAAIEALRPGIKCSELDQTARKIIADAGYGGNFGHGLGHGVGIEIHEMPALSPKCPDSIQPGNILTVEPGIYIENWGGVRIEDLLAVTGGGAVNLTHSPKELIEV